MSVKSFFEAYKKYKDSISFKSKVRGIDPHSLIYSSNLSFVLVLQDISLLYHSKYTTIRLDEEDIEYFVKKYSPKLEEELESELNALKESYKNAL